MSLQRNEPGFLAHLFAHWFLLFLSSSSFLLSSVLLSIRISSPLSFLPFNLMLSSRLYSGKVRAVLVPSVSRPTSLISLFLLLPSFCRFLLLFSSPFFSFVLLLLRSARQRCRWLSRYLSRQSFSREDRLRPKDTAKKSLVTSPVLRNFLILKERKFDACISRSMNPPVGRRKDQIRDR